MRSLLLLIEYIIFAPFLSYLCIVATPTLAERVNPFAPLALVLFGFTLIASHQRKRYAPTKMLLLIRFILSGVLFLIAMVCLGIYLHLVTSIPDIKCRDISCPAYGYAIGAMIYISGAVVAWGFAMIVAGLKQHIEDI